MIIKNNHTRNLDSVFDGIFSAVPSTWGIESRNTTFIPPVNIYESADAYHIDVNAPGRNKEDFKINLDQGMLTVSIEQKKAAENNVKVIKNEFSYNSFKRSFSITDKINTEAIQARYENGILYLVLPKKEEVKNNPKQIEIQ